MAYSSIFSCYMRDYGTIIEGNHSLTLKIPYNTLAVNIFIIQPSIAAVTNWMVNLTFVPYSVHHIKLKCWLHYNRNFIYYILHPTMPLWLLYLAFLLLLLLLHCSLSNSFLGLSHLPLTNISWRFSNSFVNYCKS